MVVSEATTDRTVEALVTAGTAMAALSSTEAGCTLIATREASTAAKVAIRSWRSVVSA